MLSSYLQSSRCVFVYLYILIYITCVMYVVRILSCHHNKITWGWCPWTWIWIQSTWLFISRFVSTTGFGEIYFLHQTKSLSDARDSATLWLINLIIEIINQISAGYLINKILMRSNNENFQKLTIFHFLINFFFSSLDYQQSNIVNKKKHAAGYQRKKLRDILKIAPLYNTYIYVLKES